MTVIENGLRRLARHVLAAPTRRWLRGRWQGSPAAPPPGWVRFGSFRRLDPISREYGFDRGTPIDRYYIEGFLARHAADVRGRVLEVKEDTYTRRFGGDRVTTADVLCLEADAPGATIVGDLRAAPHIPSDAFDCVVVTQTLQLIYDVRAAVQTLHRILKPGGVLLATVPGISQVSPHAEWGDRWAWGFTAVSARRLVEERFGCGSVDVEVYGNVMAAVGHLQGLAASELTAAELDHHDPEYQVSLGVRATKASEPRS